MKSWRNEAQMQTEPAEAIQEIISHRKENVSAQTVHCVHLVKIAAQRVDY